MSDDQVMPGSAIVRANVALTGVFALTAAYAAISFTTAAQWVGAVTAMSLFTIGVFAFLWSYWNAVQRSRTDEIAVSQLYLLMGPAIPRRVRLVMSATLVAQFAIAAITTVSRPDGPDGNPGSSLAVGFLVPMLGFGMNGLWAVSHGSFGPRQDVLPRPGDVAEIDTADAAQIGQNADHG